MNNLNSTEKSNENQSDITNTIDSLLKLFISSAKKATFRIGLGLLGLGFSYYFIGSEDKILLFLIGFGAFFICAKIGGFIDDLFDYIIQKKSTRLKNDTLVLDKINTNKESDLNGPSKDPNLDINDAKPISHKEPILIKRDQI